MELVHFDYSVDEVLASRLLFDYYVCGPHWIEIDTLGMHGYSAAERWMKWELLLEVEDVVTCFFVKSEKVHDAVLVDPYQTNAVSVVFSDISTGGTRCWCGQRLHFHVGGGGGSASVHQRIQISQLELEIIFI